MNLIPKQTGTFTSYDGSSIYYEERGEGSPIILNYGIGCLINHWGPQIKHFSRTHRVIAYDYRGHHQSPVPADRSHLTVDDLAKDLTGLMDHLGLERASLWGHSFGVQMLVRHFELFPERAHDLVFINGFVRNPLAGMFGTDVTERLFNAIKSGYGHLPETLSFLWRAGLQNPLAIQMSALAGGFNLKLTALKDAEIYARGIASMDLDAFLKLFESMLAYDGTSALEKITVPTLIIGGQKDAVTPPQHQDEIHRRIGGSDLCLVPYGSHCTQLDMPELVNLRAERFLNHLAAGRDQN